MKTILTLVITALLAVSIAAAQTSIYIGGGSSLYGDAPHGAGNLTIGICDGAGKTCSLTSFEARGSVRTPNDLVYSASTGILRFVASADSPKVHARLFVLGQGGANVTESAVGLAGTLGGGIAFSPKSAPNWSVTFAGRGVYSPVNPGWRPWVGLQLGYTFRGQ